jgi:hypothetical protein
MPAIRILLIGVPRMLSDIVTQAIASEPDMVIVDGMQCEIDDLDIFSVRRRVDVVIFGESYEHFSQGFVSRLLHKNPRIGLLAIDGVADRATLHHLVPVQDEVGPLDQTSVVGAIRAGAALRLA